MFPFSNNNAYRCQSHHVESLAVGGFDLVNCSLSVVGFFDVGHPCYDLLTPVKTRYPLTSIM